MPQDPWAITVFINETPRATVAFTASPPIGLVGPAYCLVLPYKASVGLPKDPKYAMEDNDGGFSDADLGLRTHGRDLDRLHRVTKRKRELGLPSLLASDFGPTTN